ncbi:uncharacterized protein LOC9631686 [Selaginella moellendorffii]|nr:uncharacterized protein LOC9631686 [Selaginella moellendorffii]|eukprot:XP_002967232.2 uncharacterized protein LOC9631686 [Selaginella moellendorffii]
MEHPSRDIRWPGFVAGVWRRHNGGGMSVAMVSSWSPNPPPLLRSSLPHLRAPAGIAPRNPALPIIGAAFLNPSSSSSNRPKLPGRGRDSTRRSLVRLYCSRSSRCLTIICLTSLVAALARIASLLVSLADRIFRSSPSAAPSGNLLANGSSPLGMALLSTSAMASAHLSPMIVTLRANPTFMSGLVAWMVAQASKVLTTYVVYRRWDLRMLVGSGGMPSSHSALCLGLTTSVALSHGVGDALFPVCLGFSLIVMYDATGVRRHAGMQAEVLNMIIKDLFQGHPVSEKKLKELLGHTPLQVVAGALVGILVGWWCCLTPR